MPKVWIIIAGALLLIVASSAATLVFFNLSGGESAEPYTEAVHRRFDIFEGYGRCLEQVKRAVPGEVLSVQGDDRSAQYDRSNNINMMFFEAEYRASRGVFGGFEEAITTVYARCDVSAETNRIESIKLRPSNEKEYVEVVRRPEE